MSILNDFLGYMLLYNGKKSILTTIENDMLANLATAQSEMTTFGQQVSNVFTNAMPAIKAGLMSRCGDVYDCPDDISALRTPNQWNLRATIIPTAADNNYFMYAYATITTLPNNSNALAYIGLMGANDAIGSITSLGSLPSYSTIYGASVPTPFASPAGNPTLNTTTGQYEYLTQKLLIPINASLRTNGISLYTWDNGIPGFSFETLGFVYRNASAY